MAKKDCSELARNILDIATDLSARKGINTIGDIEVEMKRLGININQDIIIDSIVEATEQGPRVSDKVSRDLATLKREARQRGDNGLVKDIALLERFVDEGIAPPVTKKKPTVFEVAQLRKSRQNIQKWLRNSFPVANKRLQKKLADLQSKIRRGDVGPKRTPQTEFRQKALRDLESKISAAQKTIADATTIRKVEADIDALRKHLEEGTVPETKTKEKPVATPQLELARSIRDDLKKKLDQSDAGQKKKLQKQIKDLESRIKAGDIKPREKIPQVRKSAELEKLEFDRDNLRKEIQRQINNLKPTTIWGHIPQFFNTARGFVTSTDFSAVLRQGGFIAFSRPDIAAKNLGKMFRSFASDQQAAKINKSIQERPNAPLYRIAKLFFAPIDGTNALSEREEQMQTTFFDKLPGKTLRNILTAPVRGSNRAYATFLNLVRADAFDTYAASLSKTGQVTVSEAKAVGNFVNVISGRGSLGAFEKAAVGLNTGFFAPRYVASRFQLITGQPFFGANARTRKLIAKEYARYLVGMGLMYVMASWWGADIEWDPRSSDFGKIRIGKTRLDPLSGISQVTVLLTRLGVGTAKTFGLTDLKPVTPAKKGRRKSRPRDIRFGDITFFLRAKLSPMFGTALNLILGKDLLDRDFGIEDVPEQLFVPLAIREIQESLEEQGLGKGTALSLAVIFGMGVQTHGTKKK